MKEARLKLEGHIDRCDAVGFDGWVVDHDEPENKLTIAVSCGTTDFGTCIADQFRKDLLDGGLYSGRYAFSFRLPKKLSTEELSAVRINIVGTEYSFRYEIGYPLVGMSPCELYAQVAAELRHSGREWRRFKACSLHIGTEKTGSTSLQSCFGLNLPLFEESGYFIPKSLARPVDDITLNHSHLAMISMNDERFDDDLRREGQVFDRDQLNQTRRDIFTRFSEEVAAASPTLHTIILSNEQCHSRLSTPEEVHNLKDFLDHFCETYSITVYLRPQHELAISQHGMFVSNGIYNIDTFPPFPPPAGYNRDIYTNRAYFDYKAMMDRWSQVFGTASLHPRIYAADTLRGGDVVSDFMADISLHGRNFQHPARSNTNIAPLGLALLNDFYRHFGESDRSGAPLLRERIRNAVRTCFPGSGATPGRAQVVAFLAQFEAGNETIRARWFPSRADLFNIDMGKFPEIAPTTTLTTAEFIEAFVKVLLEDQTLCFSLTLEGLTRLNQGLPPNTD
jgi:hypothetical protein